MPVKVTCGCGAKLAVQDSLAGKQIKCPKCSAPLTVPQGTAPPAAKAGSAAKPVSQDANPLAKLLDEVGLTASRTGRRCPQCFSDMVPEAIICIECGFNTETGRKLRVKRDILDGRK